MVVCAVWICRPRHTDRGLPRFSGLPELPLSDSLRVLGEFSNYFPLASRLAVHTRPDNTKAPVAPRHNTHCTSGARDDTYSACFHTPTSALSCGVHKPATSEPCIRAHKRL